MSDRRSGMAAAMVAFAVFLAGCTSDAPIGSADVTTGVSASPFTAPPVTFAATPSQTPPVPTPTEAPTATLDDLLPDGLAGAQWSSQIVGPDTVIGDVYSPDLGGRLAAGSDRSSDELTVATAVPVTDEGEEGIGPVTIIAAHLAGADALHMLGDYVAGWFAVSDRGTWTLMTTANPSFETDEPRARTHLGWFALYPADDTLYIIALGEEEPTDGESWYLSYQAPPDELVEQIVGGLPLRTIPSHPISEPEVIIGATPSPSSTATPPADAALEARMPAEIAGQPTDVRSIDGLDATEPNILNLAALQLMEHYSLDGSQVSAAYATAEGLSSYVLMASTIDGRTGEELKGAFVSELLSEAGARFETSSGHVGETTYVINEIWALFAVDEILFTAMYLDIGDCFEDCDPGPRPPLEDLIRASIEALP